MIHRLKIAMAALCLALCSQAVLALGLGEVTLLSKLNQPLNAEIELLQLRDLNEDEVLIALASREDFARIGIDRPYFLTDLTFKADLSNPNKPKVIVKSKKIVQEPFLNFIVQAQWPSGKILREYTLLLDLPVFSQRQAPTISSANSAPSFKAPSQTRSAAQPANGRTGDTVTVAPNETLWEIARAVRPSNGYSIQQTMLALQRLNPDAFINNNINLLKKGQVLRIPDANDINNVNEQTAISNVAQQNAQWSNDDSDDDLGAQLSGVKEPALQEVASASNEGRLKLVSPEASVDNTAGKLSGAGDSQAEALKGELAVTLEELAKTNRDNTDLRTQVQSLEDQIQTLESLIDVTNEDMRALELSANKREQELLEQQENLSAEKEAELAALKDLAEQTEADAAQTLADQQAQELESASAQQEATEQETATLDTSSDIQNTDPVVESVEPELSTDPVDDLYNQAQEQASEEVAVDPVDVEEVKVVEEAPKPIKEPVSKAKKTSIVDMLIDNIVYIAIGCILLIGGFILWLLSRVKNDDDEDDEFESDFDESAFLADIPDTNQNDDTVIMDSNDVSADDDFSENEFAPSDIDVDLNTDTHHVEAQTSDAATESEIYISLGQFDEAENLLLDALSENPANLQVKMKLLEVYAAQNASVKFNEFYADVMAAGEQADIQRANDLRETVDGIDDITVLDDVEEDKTELQFHSEPEDDTSVSESTSFDLDLSEESDEIDRLKRGGTLPADEVMSIDDSLDQLSESFEEGDLTELDLSLDDVSDLEDDLTLDDLTLDDNSDQDHTEVLNDTVDLNNALNELDQGEDVLDSRSDVEDTVEVTVEDTVEELDLPALHTLESESLGEDDLLAPNDAKPDMSIDDEMAELDAELDLDSELDLDVEASADSMSGADMSDLDLDLDDLDAELDNELESTKDVASEDIEVDESLNLDVPIVESVTDSSDELDDLTLDLDDLELEDGGDALPDDITSDSRIELDAEQENELDHKNTKDSAVDVDDLSLEDLLDSSHELEGVDAELDDLELDLHSLEEASEGVTADDMLSDLELDIDDIDLDTEDATSKVEASDVKDPVDPSDSLDDLSLDDLTLELDAEPEPSDAEEDHDSDASTDLDDDDDFGFLNDSDEIATKLDLARAYIDMGDRGGAKEIIDEIAEEGNDVQKKEAAELLKKLS